MFDSFVQFLYEMCLHIDLFFCKVLSILYSFFDVFAGIKTVKYDGEDMYLINVFFEETPAKRIFIYMAAIGIVLSFAFTIYAVIKKIFDIDDKVKSSLGGILGNQLKCILLIILMNFIILFVLKATNNLMERIVYIFNNEATEIDKRDIDFTSDQYATMGRIINTIGNYSINQSYDSRYNINTCYNIIRNDMNTLAKAGVFNFTYEDCPNSWQYYLTKIANAHDLSKSQNIDEYDDTLTKAMVACMEKIWIGSEFVPVDSYKSNVEPIKSDNTPFDALIFLAGSSNAAKNEQYNKNPDIFDTLRYDYIREGGKSIYDINQVCGDFDISFAKFDHLAIIIMGVVLAKVFLALCINCVARIFNLMLLYLISPIFISVTPLDEGEKTKQWSIAFVVQAFAVFGSVLGIRILMIFVTMIFNSKLILFDNSTMNFFGKLLMVFAVSVTLEQASKIVTGILANNAGFQSIQASDVGSAGASRIIGAAQSAGGKALGMAKSAAGSILEHSPLGTAKNLATSAIGNSKLGYVFGTGKGSKAGFDKAAEARQAEKDRKAKAEKEAKENEGKETPEEKMTKAADRMSSAADKLTSALENHGKSRGSNGGSKGGAPKTRPRSNAITNRNQGRGGPNSSNNNKTSTTSSAQGKQDGNSSSNSGDKGGNNEKAPAEKGEGNADSNIKNNASLANNNQGALQDDNSAPKEDNSAPQGNVNDEKADNGEDTKSSASNIVNNARMPRQSAFDRVDSVTTPSAGAFDSTRNELKETANADSSRNRANSTSGKMPSMPGQQSGRTRTGSVSTPSSNLNLSKIENEGGSVAKEPARRYSLPASSRNNSSINNNNNLNKRK